MHESSSSVGNFAWPSITRNPENTPLLEVLDGVVLRPIPLHEKTAKGVQRCEEFAGVSSDGGPDFVGFRGRSCWVSRPRWLCASPGGDAAISNFCRAAGDFPRPM